jgi:hypothetical protein
MYSHKCKFYMSIDKSTNVLYERLKHDF